MRCKVRGGQSLEVRSGQNLQTYGGRYHEHRLRYRIEQNTIRFISLTSTLPHRRDSIPLCVGKCGAVKVCSLWWPISRTPFEIPSCATHHSIYLTDFYLATKARVDTSFRCKARSGQSLEVRSGQNFQTYGGRYHEHRLRYRIEQNTIRFISLTSTLPHRRDSIPLCVGKCGAVKVCNLWWPISRTPFEIPSCATHHSIYLTDFYLATKARVDTSFRCKARSGQSLEVRSGQNFQTYGGRYHEHRLRYRIEQDTIRFISLSSTLPPRRDSMLLCVGECGAVKVCNIWWPISRTPFEIPSCATHHLIYLTDFYLATKARVDTSLRCKARGGQSLEVRSGQNFQIYGGRYHEHRLRYRIAQDTTRFISLTSTLPPRRDSMPLCVGECGAVKVCNIWWPISRTPFKIPSCAIHHSIYLTDFYLATKARVDTSLRCKARGGQSLEVRSGQNFQTYGGRYHEYRLRYRIAQDTIRFISLTSSTLPHKRDSIPLCVGKCGAVKICNLWWPISRTPFEISA